MQWGIMINLLWGERVPSAQDDLVNYFWKKALIEMKPHCEKKNVFLTVETLKHKQQRHKNKNTMI